MVAETLQRPTGSLTAPMTSNHWTAPCSFWVLALCLHSAVSPVHFYWECPVLHCWNLITHWQLKLVLPASLGCQLSASPYWTLPGMHRLRKVFLGSCVTADAHWVPAVWESHAGTLPEPLSPSFGGSCKLGDTPILQMSAPNSMVRECRKDDATSEGESGLRGSHSELEESPVILNPRTFWGQGPCAPDSYEAWVVASPYSAWAEFGSGVWLN